MIQKEPVNLSVHLQVVLSKAKCSTVRPNNQDQGRNFSVKVLKLLLSIAFL